jgi:heptosyltransferase-3
LRVLIIRAGALGDTLMLMPAISHLCKKAEIYVAGRSPGIDYLKPYVDHCMDIEGSGWRGLFVNGAEKYTGLLFAEPDNVVAFLKDPEGTSTKKLKEWFPEASINVFPAFPLDNRKVHMALYMGQCLEAAGLPVDARRSFEDSLKDPVMAARASFKREEWIVLHPGSGSVDKNYPPVLWLELIGRLKSSYKGRKKRIVIVLGPAEEDLRLFFKDQIDEGVVDLISCIEKDEMVTILRKAGIYIGHDSGITHLAAMMGIHVIALFKKSSPQQWAPPGPDVKIIRGKEGRPLTYLCDDILQFLETRG